MNLLSDLWDSEWVSNLWDSANPRIISTGNKTPPCIIVLSI